jgi:hypothetical protein
MRSRLCHHCELPLSVNFGQPRGRSACLEAAGHAARKSFGSRIARCGLLTHELALIRPEGETGRSVVTNNDRGYMPSTLGLRRLHRLHWVHRVRLLTCRALFAALRHSALQQSARLTTQCVGRAPRTPFGNRDLTKSEFGYDRGDGVSPARIANCCYSSLTRLLSQNT